ncbi:hypothetical protein QTP70_033490, partial [Hemibagrus guttatus]
MAYGSLHFVTFDGTNYTFKAIGVFVIVRLSSSKGSNVFTLQGEIGVLETNGQQRQVPALVRLAAYHQAFGKVEWRSTVSQEKLIVLINDVEFPVFAGVVHAVQQGFALRCPSVQYCATIYEGGLNVAVWMGDARRLSTLVEVPQNFYNRTVGLLGLWSSNTSDDFLLSNGHLLSSSDNNPPPENRLLLFGQSWAVPLPESLLFTTPPLTPFQPVSTELLMASVSPDTLSRLQETCEGSMQCVHDILATNNTDLGLQSLRDQKQIYKLAVTFGNTPPILSEPTVIRCKVNTTVRVQFVAQDANRDSVSFSLLYPRPPLASIGKDDGVLVWTPLNIQPVMLTVQVSDQVSSSLLIPILQLCSCLNGGTCQYQSVAENHLQGKFQVVGCLCPPHFGGRYCGNRTDVCKGQPCFPGVDCYSQREGDSFSCGECPSPTVSNGKRGYKCFENDFCLPPFRFPCHKMADCYSTGYNYTCRCKPGFTGDGHNCTDIDECQNPETCPNAKFVCVNTLGSVSCSCRYQSSLESNGCGDSPNPTGFLSVSSDPTWLYFPAKLLHLVARGRSWGSQVELVEAEQEMGPSLSFVLSPDSDIPASVSRARTVISPDPEEDILLSASGSEELEVGEEGHSSLDLPPQSVVFEELLNVLMQAVAKLNLNWPEKEVSTFRSKLDNRFLTSGNFWPSGQSYTPPQDVGALGLAPEGNQFLEAGRSAMQLPFWDLSVVLEWLLEAPFEPMESASERFLILKTALLLALASLRRVGHLQALSVTPTCLEFAPGMSKAILHRRVGYVPKVPRMAGCPVILHAFCEQERLYLLCPVRDLRTYVHRLSSWCKSSSLEDFESRNKGNLVSKQCLAHWVVEAITQAYEARRPPVAFCGWWNIFNVSVTWNSQKPGQEQVKQLEQILSMGFQNKFYGARISQLNSGLEDGNEFRINVSSDTPHWYIMDYLSRVGHYYDITSAYVGDLDECNTNETLCTQPAVCYNTYGGYRCVCNGTDMNKLQSCILVSEMDGQNKSSEITWGDNKALILGLVLGIGIPLLLLLLLAALACFCCCHRKTVTGEIPHLLP